MSDSNAHQPIDLPLALFSPELGGGQHVRRKGVPLTNLYTTVLGESRCAGRTDRRQHRHAVDAVKRRASSGSS